jgi:diaminohydroxyphosphoribosylaminopyrimidine deaminase/5-amino-6-(5-phosphoribosylamino)uracil reductase
MSRQYPPARRRGAARALAGNRGRIRARAGATRIRTTARRRGKLLGVYVAGGARQDHAWMWRAIELSRNCPPATEAYSVGAVIVDADGREIANGYSRDTDPHVHAEESALSKLSPVDLRLAAATLYSTLEPCSQRRSRPRTCTQLIIAAAIPRVVIAWREPSLFVADCRGVELLRDAGVTVVELADLAAPARAVNSHLRL